MTAARISHAASGRLRVRLEGRAADVRSALDCLEERAAGEHGVRGIGVDPRRGSALLEYDPDEMSLESAVGLVREAHAAFSEVVPPALAGAAGRTGSRLSAGIRRGLDLADRRVLGATGGAVDIRMLVPIGLAAVAVRQLVRTGPALPSIPWYVVAWYSFDSFVKLHGVQPTVRDGSAA